MHVHRQVLATAERAADTGQGEPHLLGRHRQRAADLLLVDVQPLGGDEQVDATVLGRHRQPGLRPEERLVLHADLVVALDHDVGRRRPGRPCGSSGAGSGCPVGRDRATGALGQRGLASRR